MPIDAQNIISWLIQYQYAILLPLSIIEGPFVTVLAGFLASAGTLNIWIVYVIVVLGDTIGDALYYALGRYGKNTIFPFIERRFPSILAKTKRFEHAFHRNGPKILIVGKFTYSLSVLSLFSAGVAKYPFKSFLVYTFFPTLPKSLAFLLLGYYFGASYTKIKMYLDETAAWMLAVALLILVTLFVRNYMRTSLAKRFEQTDQEVKTLEKNL